MPEAIPDAAISTGTAHAGTLDFDTASVSTAEADLPNGHISESPSNSEITEMPAIAATSDAAPLGEDESMADRSTTGAPNTYDAESIQTSRRHGSRADAPWHVYRRHRQRRLRPPPLGANRQRRRRSRSRLRQSDRCRSSIATAPWKCATKAGGVPVDMHPTRGVSALEVVFTELHAGGKFGGGAYGASGGLHGVGAAVVNALSNRMEVEVDREGRTWVLGFKNQEPVRKKGLKADKTSKLQRLEKTFTKKPHGHPRALLARQGNLRPRRGNPL